jgi:hypothetical protein
VEFYFELGRCGLLIPLFAMSRFGAGKTFLVVEYGDAMEIIGHQALGPDMDMKLPAPLPHRFDIG